MTVNDEISTIRVASGIQEWSAGKAVVSIEVCVQIPFRISGRIHDGIADDGVGDGEPSKIVGICAGQRIAVMCGNRLRFIIIRLRRWNERWFRKCVLIFQRFKFVLFLLLRVLLPKDVAAASGCHEEECDCKKQQDLSAAHNQSRFLPRR